MIKIIILLWILSLIWIGFEMWRAPHGYETKRGLVITKPLKKLKNLFIKKSKSGSYSDLEKFCRNRGRSKY